MLQRLKSIAFLRSSNQNFIPNRIASTRVLVSPLRVLAVLEFLKCPVQAIYRENVKRMCKNQDQANGCPAFGRMRYVPTFSFVFTHKGEKTCYLNCSETFRSIRTPIK